MTDTSGRGPWSVDRHGSSPRTASVAELVAEPRPPGGWEEERSASRNGHLFSLFVVIGFFILGLTAYGPALPHLSSRLFTTISPDYSLWIWSMEWTTHALTHGLNPFFSNALFVPTGINLGDNTSAPLLGLLTTPISLSFGPIVSANLLIVVAMPISATSAYFALRAWQVWAPAAALGGLIYGFSPYMIGQGLGHPQLFFLPLPPLIAMTLTSIVQRRGSPFRLGIALGLLVAAQFLISPEVLAGVLVFGALALAYTAIGRLGTLRESAGTIARSVGIAALVAAVILAYPVWMMVAGPQHFVGSTIPAVNPYHNDLWSTVVPGPLQQVSLGMRSLGRQVEVCNCTILGGHYDPTESGGYLGIAVLLALIIFAWRGRRSLRMQVAVLLFVAAEVLALGPHLSVGGHLTTLGLPFLVFDHIPLLDNILPSRLNFEAGAAAAAMIAFGVDDVYTHRHREPRRDGRSAEQARRRRGAAVAAIVLVAVVAMQLPQWPYRSQAASVLPPAIRRAVPGGNPIAITFPYTVATIAVRPLVWQAEDGYAFRLLGGYGYRRGAHGRASTFPAPMKPPQLQQFLLAEESSPFLVPFFGYGVGPPAMGRRLFLSVREALAAYHVRLVIVDRSVRGGATVAAMFTSVLGPPRVSSGEFRLWADWSR